MCVEVAALTGGAAVRMRTRTNDRRAASPPAVEMSSHRHSNWIKITLNEVGREGGSLVDNLHLEKRDFHSLKSYFLQLFRLSTNAAF